MSTTVVQGTGNGTDSRPEGFSFDAAIERAISVYRNWQAGPWTAWLFFTFLIGICVVVAWIGIVPTRRFGHDVLVPIENGWRIANGQIPHVDYYTPFGVFTFLPATLGLILSGYSIKAIGYANAVMGFGIGLWSWRLTRGRMSAGPRFFSCALVVGLMLGLNALGTPPNQSTHAMSYNRLSYALMGLLLLEAFQKSVSSSSKGSLDNSREALAGGISTGAVLALLFFLKPSYFLVAATLVVISFWLFSSNRRRLVGIPIGFAVGAMPSVVALRFHLGAMLADLIRTAHNRAVWGFGDGPLDIAYDNKGYFAILVLLAILVALQDQKEQGFITRVRFVPVALALIGGECLIRTSNWQGASLPMTAIFSLILLNALTLPRLEMAPTTARSTLPGYLACLALVVGLFGQQLVLDLHSVAFAAMSKLKPLPPDVGRFTAPRLAPLALFDFKSNPVAYADGRVYADSINDGIALLQKESRPDQTIMTMDQSNPFPFALNRKPAWGGAPIMVTEADPLTADKFFGNVDIVMVPKKPGWGTAWIQRLLRMYGAALNERFHLQAETDYWYMYKRN